MYEKWITGTEYGYLHSCISIIMSMSECTTMFMLSIYVWVYVNILLSIWMSKVACVCMPLNVLRQVCVIINMFKRTYMCKNV